MTDRRVELLFWASVAGLCVSGFFVTASDWVLIPFALFGVALLVALWLMVKR